VSYWKRVDTDNERVYKTMKIKDFAIIDDEHAHGCLFKRVRSGTVPCLAVRARTENRSLTISCWSEWARKARTGLGSDVCERRHRKTIGSYLRVHACDLTLTRTETGRRRRSDHQTSGGPRSRGTRQTVYIVVKRGTSTGTRSGETPEKLRAATGENFEF